MRTLLFAVAILAAIGLHADDGSAFREAQARLEAKKKASTTQAATRPAESPDVIALREAVRVLTAQNADLRKQLADLKHPKPLKVNAHAPWDTVKVGMSYDEVERIRNSVPTTFSTGVIEKVLGENETIKSVQWEAVGGGSCIINFDKSSNSVTAIDITAP